MPKKTNYIGILIAAIIYVVIAEIVHVADTFLTMNFYLMPQYFSVWSKVMMPNAGPPPMSFYVYSILFAFITGLIFAYIYNLIKNSVPGKKELQKGICYGIILFLINGIPGFLSLYLLINLPFVLIVSWMIENFVIFLIGGIVIAYLVK